MAANRDDIQRWIDKGIADGAKWMIVVCDSFDYDDYPVYADSVEEFDEKYDHFNGKNMQRIMEVYDLEMDIPSQMNLRRAWSYPSLSRFNPHPVDNRDPLVAWMDKK